MAIFQIFLKQRNTRTANKLQAISSWLWPFDCAVSCKPLCVISGALWCYRKLSKLYCWTGTWIINQDFSPECDILISLPSFQGKSVSQAVVKFQSYHILYMHSHNKEIIWTCEKKHWINFSCRSFKAVKSRMNAHKSNFWLCRSEKKKRRIKNLAPE